MVWLALGWWWEKSCLARGKVLPVGLPCCSLKRTLRCIRHRSALYVPSQRAAFAIASHCVSCSVVLCFLLSASARIGITFFLVLQSAVFRLLNGVWIYCLIGRNGWRKAERQAASWGACRSLVCLFAVVWYAAYEFMLRRNSSLLMCSPVWTSLRSWPRWGSCRSGTCAESTCGPVSSCPAAGRRGECCWQ